MKKIVMAATLLSIVTGGEVSALAAKTTHQSVAKITHVKVTKHKVTGYTTAKSHITLMKLKHGEKASATANKKGKFTVKVKKNNLSKLKFKLKATKPGLKARTYTHKVKKAVQAIDDGVITETPASTTPAKPDEGKKPEKDKEKPQSKPGVNIVHVTDTQTAQDKIKAASTRFQNAQTELFNKSGINFDKDKYQKIVNYVNTQHQPNKKAELDKLKKDANGPYKTDSKFQKFVDSVANQKNLYEVVHEYDLASSAWEEIVKLANTPIPTPAPAPTTSHDNPAS